MKFRKKPVVIEATQWFKYGDHSAVMRYQSYDPDMQSLGWIETLEDGHVVTPGDWIITGVKGEHYPCKPDIFEMTYEPVEVAGRKAGVAPEQWAKAYADIYTQIDALRAATTQLGFYNAIEAKHKEKNT
jgi:hypothetical protein